MAAPKREVLKAADVCQLAGLQPYVLRSWEAEFPGLGTTRSGGSRIYGQADLDFVLRVKALVYGEGLTLAGARRRLEDAPESPAPETDRLVVLDESARAAIVTVRTALSELLTMLSEPVATAEGAGDPAGTEAPRAATRRRTRPAATRSADRDVAQPG